MSEILIHHGGKFIKTPDLQYINEEVESFVIDPDYICYPDIWNHITEDRYTNVLSLSYKASEEPLVDLRKLLDNASCIHLADLAKKGKCDIYVEHAVHEAEIVTLLSLPRPVISGTYLRAENERVVNENETYLRAENTNTNRKRKRTVQAEIRDENREPQADSEYADSNDPPTLVEEDENDDGEEVQSKKNKHPYYNPNAYPQAFEVGLQFNDGEQFKKAMIAYAISSKRDIYWKKNQKKFVSTKCKGKGCPFYCSAGWDQRDKCFQIKAITLEHRCNPNFILGIISQKWLEDTYEDKIRENTCIGKTEFKEYIKADLNINITLSMASRTIDGVKDKLSASYKGQFKRLRDYAQECLNSNPGSTVIIKTDSVVADSPCIFQRMYVCFGALKRGFLEGCRKVIGLDGCFLKGLLKGEILSAVGRDANNQMYPIAWAVVEIENNSSWRWFLELLKADLGMWNNNEWCLMSDQQKGLTNVIAELFPGVEHRNCARHVHANWSKSHKGKVLKNHFWSCAKSTTQPQLEEQLAALEKRDSTAKKDLEKYPMRFWCKAYFGTGVKCDIVHNNLSEAFNSTLVKARSKPIIPMLEEIRVDVMKRIAKKKASVEKWSTNNGPLLLKKLNCNILESNYWKVIFNGDDGYEVRKSQYRYKVSLQRRTCTCRAWDLSGIPCPHAICAIFNSGSQPADYMDECYSKEAYKRTYSHTIQPMNGEMLWPKTQYGEIHAPVPKKMTGRPKKKRKQEESEKKSSQSTTRLSRKGRVMTCKACNQQGHNKRYCPTLSTPTRPSSSTGSTSSTISAARGRGRGKLRTIRGRGSTVRIGIYTNPHTGEVSFNRGLPSQRIIYSGGRGRSNTSFEGTGNANIGNLD